MASSETVHLYFVCNVHTSLLACGSLVEGAWRLDAAPSLHVVT